MTSSGKETALFSSSVSDQILWPRDLLVRKGLNLIEWQVGSSLQSSQPNLLEELNSLLPGQRFFSPLATLGEFVVNHGNLNPEVFIFHVSRCGSTLAARLLALNPENRVFNEPPAITQRPFWQPPSRSKLSPGLQASVIAAHGLTPQTVENRLVIKTSSMTLFSLPLIDQLFPKAHKILIVREPLAVLVSNLTVAFPSLGSDRGRRSLAKRMGEPEEIFSQLGTEEAMARVLARKFDAAAKSLEHFDLILDYADFPDGWLHSLGPYLGEDLGTDRLQEVLGKHSKFGSAFEGDDREKHAKADRETRRVNESICLPAWQNLRAAIEMARG